MPEADDTRREPVAARMSVGSAPPGLFHFVRANSPVMCALEAAVDNVALSNIPVLLLGEHGTGKQTLALQIHQLSSHLGECFREVTCASLSPTAASTAFPGMNNHDAGGWADGTLYCTDIADLPSSWQARLLQLLSETNGAADGVPAGPRIVASSTRSLEEEVRAGRFREDLYYRLSGVCLRVPPLRHRREDILVLANHFLEMYADLFGRSRPVLTSRTTRFFLEYGWPGNVRELENAAKTIVALGDEQVALAALRSSVLDSGHHHHPQAELLSLKQVARAASRRAERDLILKALSRTRWNRKRAAQELQISYKALLYKLKQIGLDEGSSSWLQGEES